MRLSEPSQSAIGLLNVLLAGSLLVPVLLFVVVASLNYRAAFTEAQHELLRSSEVAREHAAKVLEGQSQVADRVNDLVHDLDVADIRQSEYGLHEAFLRIVDHLPQIQSVLLANLDGHPLVSAGTYPVPATVDLNNRDYFKAVIGRHPGTYISSLQTGDINRQLFFGLARPWTGLDGTLRGVIDVAVSPEFFQEFYRVLLEGEDGGVGKVLTLIREDGQILARYPPLPGLPPRTSVSAAFLTAAAAHPDQGVYETQSVVGSDAPERVYAYRKVQGYPVYVVAGRSRSAILAGWRGMLASHLIFGIPATLALFAVTWTALARTRREERALALAKHEIARREHAEAALLRAQRLEAVGQMTGGVAHDFNNLLTVVLGSAEMLRRRANDPDRVRLAAEQIALAAKRGGEITQKLLAFARRQVVKPETIDLNACLRDFKELLDRAAEEASTVCLDLDPGALHANLDPGHFEAAMLNLVGNARDAMPGGGTIAISTRTHTVGTDVAHPDLAPGEYVLVSVTDVGSGMDAATVAKAFEPFFTTKEVGRGTGLGLSQVYGFAKQSAGDVRIVSVPGQGTTVELLLPRTMAPLPSTAGADSQRALLRGQGLTVLVVEDEPSVLEAAVESLNDLGYATITAADAAGALVRLQEQTAVDILFSDIVMPGGMNGVQLSTEARRIRPAIRVLLTSGYTGGPTVGHDTALLQKPYDQQQLASRLRQIVQE